MVYKERIRNVLFIKMKKMYAYCGCDIKLHQEVRFHFSNSGVVERMKSPLNHNFSGMVESVQG